MSRKITFMLAGWALGTAVFMSAWVPAGMPLLPALIFFGPLGAVLVALLVRDLYHVSAGTHPAYPPAARHYLSVLITFPRLGHVPGVISCLDVTVRPLHPGRLGGPPYMRIECGRVDAPKEVLLSFLETYCDASGTRPSLWVEPANGPAFECPDALVTALKKAAQDGVDILFEQLVILALPAGAPASAILSV